MMGKTCQLLNLNENENENEAVKDLCRVSMQILILIYRKATFQIDKMEK